MERSQIPNTMQLRERTIRGVRTTLMGTVGGAVLQMLILVVLARLLTPRDYGAYAGALIIMQPLQAGLLSTTERAIVIQGDLSDEGLTSVQGVGFIVMIGLAVLLAVLGLLFAQLFHSSVGTTLAACAPTLPIAAMAMTGRARLRRGMDFGKLVTTDLVAQLLGVGVVAILCAALGLGPFSLVLGAMTQALVQAIGYRWGNAGQFRMNFRLRQARPILATVWSVGRISFLEIAQGQIPSIFIATFLGATQLGLFSRAYSLVQMPIELITNSISRVLYSSFVLVRDDQAKFNGALYKMLEVATVVILPLAVGMAVAAPQLVDALLGKHWVSARYLIPWLTIGSALTMTGTLLSNVVEAALHLRAKFYGQLFTIVVALALFALLAPYGLVAACEAFSATWLCYLLGQVVVAKLYLRLEVRRLLVSFLPGSLSGAAIGLYIFAVQSFLSHLTAGILLIIEVFGSGILLTAVIAVFFPELFRSLLGYSGIDRLVRKT